MSSTGAIVPVPTGTLAATPAAGTTDFAALAAKVGLTVEVRDALLTAMDPAASLDFPVKILSQAKEADVDALIPTVQLPGIVDQSTGQTGPLRGPSFLQSNAIRLLFAEARSMVAPVVPVPLSTALVPATAPSSKRQVKHSLVLSQTDETLSDRITESEHIDYLIKYGDHYGAGAKPTPDHEPTSDQLSGLKAVLEDGQPPFVDFAIFVANHHRMLNRLKLMGMRMMDDGTYQRAEIKGPADFTVWKSCWKVFKLHDHDGRH